MAKVICGSNLETDYIKKFMSSISIGIIRLVPTLPIRQRLQFMYNANKLIYDSFHTRHMFMSMNHIDTIMLTKNHIFNHDNFTIHIQNIKITDKTPKHISDWITTSRNINTIPIMSLALYPVLMVELKRLQYPALDEMDNVKKLVKNIRKCLKQFDNPIAKNVLIACDECFK